MAKPNTKGNGGSSLSADEQRAKLSEVLRRNLPAGAEGRLQKGFDNIVWEIWIAPGDGKGSRRLDPTLFLALNSLKIQADSISRMPEFKDQASDDAKKMIENVLKFRNSNLRNGLIGRPRSDKAHNVAAILYHYYEKLYQRKPSQYDGGDFVNILSQIFNILGVESSAPEAARKCLALGESRSINC
jgi:hypothetical protein